MLLDLMATVPQARVFHLRPPQRLAGARGAEAEPPVEYLVVVPDGAMAAVSAVLAMHAGKHVLDLRSAELFDRYGPPAYFHRCEELCVHARLAGIRLREAEIRAQEANRRRQLHGALEADERSLMPLVTLVVSSRAAIVAAFEAVVSREAEGARVSAEGTPEAGAQRADARLDCALVDAEFPCYGAVRAIDWLQAVMPSDCIGLVVAAERHELAWNLVRGRGVRRVATVLDDTRALLEAGRARNVARRDSWRAARKAKLRG